MKKRFLKVSFLAALVFQCPEMAMAKDVDWGAINPEQKDATFVKDNSACLECHEDYIKAFEKTKHARVFKYAGSNKEGNECEACHGPASEHVKGPIKRKNQGLAPIIISYKAKSELTSQQKSSICLNCHEKGLRMEWKGGSHNINGVGCNSCHYVMERRSDKNLFVSEDSKKACFACHSERRAQLQRSSHMPLREGKMDCASCHNPHGSAGPKMLKTATVNETCYQCHAEKRGPFVWEHAPVNENCAACHDPHGSNNPKLLLAKGSFLCTKCHSYGGHSALLNSQFVSANVSGGCVNCHSRIHGSNHPSGVRFQR